MGPLPQISSEWLLLVPYINHSFPIVIYKCRPINMLLRVLLNSTTDRRALVVLFLVCFFQMVTQLASQICNIGSHQTYGIRLFSGVDMNNMKQTVFLSIAPLQRCLHTASHFLSLGELTPSYLGLCPRYFIFSCRQ